MLIRMMSVAAGLFFLAPVFQPQVAGADPLELDYTMQLGVGTAQPLRGERDLVLSGRSGHSALSVKGIEQRIDGGRLMIKVRLGLWRDGESGAFKMAIPLPEDVTEIFYGDEKRLIWTRDGSVDEMVTRNKLQIAYMPFQLGTLRPVTRKELEEGGFCKGYFDPGRDEIVRISSLLAERGPRKGAGLDARVMIRQPDGRVFYVGAAGIVADAEQIVGMLNSAQLKMLEQSAEAAFLPGKCL